MRMRKRELLDLTLCGSGYPLELEKTPLCLGDGVWLFVEVKTAVKQATFQGGS